MISVIRIDKNCNEKIYECIKDALKDINAPIGTKTINKIKEAIETKEEYKEYKWKYNK